MKTQNNYEYRVKIVIIGPQAVGKSSLLSALCNETFSTEHITTIGVDYGTISLKKENKQYRLCLWDTSGNKIFMPITRGYFNDSIVCIIMFDLNDISTFQQANEWYHTYIDKCPNTIIILVGSKVDKIKKSLTQESYTYGLIGKKLIDDFVHKNHLIYMEISSLTHYNITELKNTIIDNINEKISCGILKPNETVNLTMYKINKYSTNKQHIKHGKHKENIGCCIVL